MADTDSLFAKLRSNPLTSKADWNMQDVPPDSLEGERRINDFLTTHAQAGRPWEETQQNFKQHFPDLDPYSLKKPYQQLGQGLKLDQARQSFAGREERTGQWLGRRVIPFGSTAVNLARTIGYGRAVSRLNEGKPEDEDYSTIAAYERIQELDNEANKSWGGSIVSKLAHIPAIAGEFATGGWLLRGLGIGGSAAARVGAEGATVAIPRLLSTEALKAVLKGTPGYLGRTAARTAVVPSMYAEQWAQGNVQAGRDPLDPRGFPTAFGLGMMQTAVLGSLTPVAGKLIPQAGATAFVARNAAKGPIGVAETYAADALSRWSGLKSDYGSLQDILDGKHGDALREGVASALTFSAFGVLHEAKEGTPASQANAAEVARYQQALRGMAERPDRAVDPIAEAVLNILNANRRKGLSADRAGKELMTAHDIIARELKDNPAPTRKDVVAAAAKAPEAVRELAQAMAATIPEPKPTEAPQQPVTASAAPEPPAAQPASEPAAQAPEAAPAAPPMPPTPPAPEPAAQAPEPTPAATTPPGPPQGQETPIRPPGPPRTPPDQPIRPPGFPTAPPQAPAEQLHPATRAFLEVFPNAKASSTGGIRAVVGNSWVSIESPRDPEANRVRIDFGNETPGVPATMQAGSKNLLSDIKTLIGKLSEAGVGIEYRAIDSNRKTFKKPRADIYAKALEEAGYEQVGGPGPDKDDFYRWQPKGEAPAVRSLPVMKDNYRKPLKHYADVMYRETDIDNVRDFLPGTGTTGNRMDLHVSNTPDMALGQGENRGVLLEFGTEGIEGVVNRKKPTADFLYVNGQAEFIARDVTPSDISKHLISITIKPDAKSSKGMTHAIRRELADLEKQGWTKEKLPDGSFKYSRPEKPTVSTTPPGFPTAPPPEPGTGLINPVQTGVPGIVKVPAKKGAGGEVPPPEPTTAPPAKKSLKGRTKQPPTPEPPAAQPASEPAAQAPEPAPAAQTPPAPPPAEEVPAKKSLKKAGPAPLSPEEAKLSQAQLEAEAKRLTDISPDQGGMGGYEEGMPMPKELHDAIEASDLTDREKQVLRLRWNTSLRDLADEGAILNETGKNKGKPTTFQNLSILEKRALKKIKADAPSIEDWKQRLLEESRLEGKEDLSKGDEFRQESENQLLQEEAKLLDEVPERRVVIPAIQKILNDAVQNGERVVHADVLEALEEFYNWDEIAAAKKAAGSFPPGVVGKTLRAKGNAASRQAEGGYRKYLTRMQIAQLVQEHEERMVENVRRELQADGATQEEIEISLRSGIEDGTRKAGVEEARVRREYLAGDVAHEALAGPQPAGPEPWDEPAQGLETPVSPEERAKGGIGGGQENAHTAAGPQAAQLEKTALAQQVVDLERRKEGREELKQAMARSDESVAARARRIQADNPNAAHDLLNDLEKKPRPIEDYESSILLDHKISLENEQDRLVAQANALSREIMVPGGRHRPDYDQKMAQRVEMDRRYDEIGQQRDRFDKIVDKSKSETGRGLRWFAVLKARDYSLQGMLNQARIAKGEPLTMEEHTQIIELQDTITKLQARIAELENAGKGKSSEATEARVDLLQKGTRPWKKKIEDFKDMTLTPAQKVLRGLTSAWDVSRAIMTAFDLSSVFRQGGILTFAHPAKAGVAFPDMVKAFFSQRVADRVMEQIRQRDSYERMVRDNLYLADPDAKLSGQEESFIGRWTKKIPGLAGSERAFNTFLNRMRADVYDSMTASLAKNGRATPAEGEAIAHFINVSTGRGGLGMFEKSAVGMARIFFSPRFVASRFQTAALQPLWGGTLKTRGVIASEYARALMGLGLFYGLMSLNDDAKISFEPRSADFGKVVIGNTHLDPLAGLAQLSTFAARMATRQTANGKGKVRDLRGGDLVDVATRFGRSKLAPTPGGFINVWTGENVVGNPVTPMSQLDEFVTPLAVSDVKKALEDQGATQGTITSLLALLGMGVQTYEKGSKKREVNKGLLGESLDVLGVENHLYDAPPRQKKSFSRR